ncbi:GbsR/MarR family transcriptional regulator [Halocatena pleomorpha]|uniref:HTH-type transcriptional regulator n=1 Tax=Halocatena pleomorpha TaxID=1785090 RepID=A0A3P3RHQ2_9EURY|nr:transcriptional regulator [Halocatena pleomorpha]RRJ33097.1 transcriptional regulator [Halocatena pleomorpha]
MGTTDETTEARETVIEAIERSAEIYGLKRSYGRLYGILFFEPEPLSLDGLVDRSGYAKSTVSNAMGTLERFHMVYRRSIPGEGKRAYFEAETDLWYVFQQFLQQEIRREIKTMTRALEDAEELLEASDADRAERDLERVRRLKRVYDQSAVVVDLLSQRSLSQLQSLVRRGDNNGS